MEILKLKVIEYWKQHWKRILIGACGGCVVLAIVFSFPLIPIVVENTKIEYTTELKQEPYTATEAYTSSEVVEKLSLITSGFYIVVPAGVEISFAVDKPETRLVGQFDNTIQGSFTIFDVASHIVWETFGSRGLIDLPLPQGQYRARFRENLMWGEECYINLALKWNDVEQVTMYRDVVKYQQTPLMIPNYIKTSRVEKVTLWKYLFS